MADRWTGRQVLADGSGRPYRSSFAAYHILFVAHFKPVSKWRELWSVVSIISKCTPLIPLAPRLSPSYLSEPMLLAKKKWSHRFQLVHWPPLAYMSSSHTCGRKCGQRRETFADLVIAVADRLRYFLGDPILSPLHMVWEVWVWVVEGLCACYDRYVAEKPTVDGLKARLVCRWGRCWWPKGDQDWREDIGLVLVCNKWGLGENGLDRLKKGCYASDR